jgi:hypothetical protein
MRRIGAVAGTIAALALGLGACSSSSASSTTTTNATSSYVAKANALCHSINAKLATIQPPNPFAGVTAGTLPAWGAYLSKALPVAQTGVAQLAALKPPAPLKGHVAVLISGDQAQVADIEAAIQGASSGNIAAFRQAWQKIQTDGTAGGVGAKAAGLKKCAGATG